MLISSAPKTFWKSRKLKGLPTDFRFQKKKKKFNFQKCDFLEGFEGFVYFDVKTKKLYFSSLILLASKKSQKSGSACPSEPIYWTWMMEFLVFNQKTNYLGGFEPFFHFDVKTKKLYFSSLIWPASKFFPKSRKLKDFPTDFHKNIIIIKKHARRVGARALTRCTFHSFSPLFSYDFTKSSNKSLFFEKWFCRIRKKRQKSPFLKYNKFRPRLHRVKRTQNVHKRNSPCRPCMHAWDSNTIIKKFASGSKLSLCFLVNPVQSLWSQRTTWSLTFEIALKRCSSASR